VTSPAAPQPNPESSRATASPQEGSKLLTWDIAEEVISQLEENGGWGAEYLVPMPAPHVIAR